MTTISATIELGDLTFAPATTNLFAVEREAMTANTWDLDDIYRQYGAMVRRRCIKILRREDDADDAMQEVFVRVMRSLSEFRGQASPATWLYRIATNICLNRLRDAGNRERLDKENYAPLVLESTPEHWPRDFVVKVLSEFDAATRETVMYSEVEEMSCQEIGAVMGCSASLVRKRITRFKERAPIHAARLLKAKR